MGKRLAELGLVPKTGTPQELQAVYEADVERWRGVIERANLKIEQSARTFRLTSKHFLPAPC